MTLTKKHFITFAEIIKTHWKSQDENGKAIIERFTMALCGYFSQENPLFNSERFISACGFNEVAQSNVMA